MRKNEVETFGESKLNVITLIKDIIPNGAILKIIFDNPIQLDYEFKSLYKSRYITSFLQTIIEEFGNEENLEYTGISAEGLLIIKSLIEDRYKIKWQKLYDLLNREYDALSPFDIELNEDSTDSFITVKDKTSYKDNDSSYGFNSVESVPTDTSDGESNRDYSRENPKHREYTRKGNIGNTTRQELIRQEREVLQYQFITTIYDDVVDVLCRNTYKFD